MFCTHCGRRITEDSSFCCFCGKAVSAQNENKINTGFANYGVDPRVYAPVPAPPRSNNGFSIAGFVLSLVSIFLTLFISIYDFSEYFPLSVGGASFFDNFFCAVSAIAGLALSIVGTVKSKKTGKGKGLGISGIVISAISLVLLLATVIFVIIFLILFCIR